VVPYDSLTLPFLSDLQTDSFVICSIVVRELSEYQVIEMVWQLAETMIFTRGPVLPGLLDWVQRHFRPHLEASFSELCSEAFESEVPTSFKVHEHAEYWPSIFAFLVRGITKQARHLLSLHPLSEASGSESKENAFAILNDLLKTMPMIKVDLETADFQTQMKAWNAKVAAAASRQDIFINRPAELKTIFSILTGDVKALAKASNDWAILLVGLVLYGHATSKPHEVRGLLSSIESLVKERIEQEDGAAEDSLLLEFAPTIGRQSDTVDTLVQAIVRLDTVELLIGVLELNNPWFSAHFLDLLSLCDSSPFEPTDPSRPSTSSTYHELALLEYATSLSTNNVPVRLIADYLGCCPQFGRDYLAHLIARQPIHSEREASKLLSLCQTFQLGSTNTAQRLVQSVVSQRAKRGRLASALAWAQGNQAVQLADSLLNSAFVPLFLLTTPGAEKTVQSQSLKLSLIVEALASSPRVVHSSVQFLQIYAQVLKAHRENDLKEMVILLGRALGAELAPKRFWLAILFDCTSTLEQLKSQNSGPVFSSSEIYDLMQCLEEAEKRNDQQMFNRANSPKIRLTLSHHLSDAILAGL
jgi:hypothetical protein